jgi:hypothetical protein
MADCYKIKPNSKNYVSHSFSSHLNLQKNTVMTHTQRLESITHELNDFGKNYKNQNEPGLGAEFEEAAKAIQHLVKVYNYGYEGYEVDVWNKHVSQKLNSLQRVIKVKSSQQHDQASTYILGSLSNYASALKMIH